MENDIVEYLYNQFPFYERQGKKAFKPGLYNSRVFDEYFGYPHTFYKTIHIAGTNGKGSTSHMLASVLQEQGYKTGLFTSPHVVNFNERIKINGVAIDYDYIREFVSRNKIFLEKHEPSFFEVVTIMAFQYFKDMNVEVAVIETGLGGRLDCTNLIHPLLSVITNISYDHKDILGNTLQKIASEKAGIIKQDIPIVIGETNDETKQVFIDRSVECCSAIKFADQEITVASSENSKAGFYYVHSDYFTGEVELGLLGHYQYKNLKTVISALDMLKESLIVDEENIKLGLKKVLLNTGLLGRWQQLASKPDVICDIGHNEAGIREVLGQIDSLKYKTVHFVFGMVNDKDICQIIKMLPKHYRYYITQASIERALSVEKLSEMFLQAGIEHEKFEIVGDAIKKAQKNAVVNDLIFIGGSNFVVADALKSDIFLHQAIA